MCICAGGGAEEGRVFLPARGGGSDRLHLHDPATPKPGACGGQVAQVRPAMASGTAAGEGNVAIGRSGGLGTEWRGGCSGAQVVDYVASRRPTVDRRGAGWRRGSGRLRAPREREAAEQRMEVGWSRHVTLRTPNLRSRPLCASAGCTVPLVIADGVCVTRSY